MSDSTKVEIHEVANLFPLMGTDEFEALKADIAAHGLKEPLWTHKGKLIDGRNRCRACQELGVTPQTREWDGKGSLVAFVVSVNLHRRHLSAGQRAAVAADMEPMLAKEAKERQRAAGGDRKSRTAKEKAVSVKEKVPEPIRVQARDQAAKLAGTSGRYVQQAKAVKEKAPELYEKVKAGQMTLPQASREVERTQKRAELQKKATEAVESQPSGESLWRIVTGDCLAELEKLSKDRVHPNLIFADPPYNIGVDYGGGEAADRLDHDDFVWWCQSWLAACRNLLADDGSLWVLISDEYAAEIGVNLKLVGLHVRAWVKWYETFGVCNSAASNFSRTSRHLFYCVKSPKRFTWNADAVSRPSDRQTKYDDARANPGGKVWDDVWEIPRLVGTAAERIPDFPTQLPLALLRPVIGCSSNPGDLVLDPFNGSGTTGAAAVELGRRYVGIEKSPKFAELATLRLKGVRREAS